MDAESYAEFNQMKAAALRALTPAKIIFETAAPGRVFDVSFGEKQNEGGLHSSGQVIENERVGYLFMPVAQATGHTPGSEHGTTVLPKIGMTFRHEETGHRYRIVSPIVALPNEAVIKCGCIRVEK